MFYDFNFPCMSVIINIVSVYDLSNEMYCEWPPKKTKAMLCYPFIGKLDH